MKHNHFDMLPVRAFKPRSGSRFTAFGGGGMTLEGGGGFFEDIVEVLYNYRAELCKYLASYF
jgi:hypothetical protein